jgi:hypothetical protein
MGCGDPGIEEDMMTAVKKWRCALAVLMVLTCAPMAQAAPFTLLPGADISGEPGSTIGWGYELTNESTDWLVFTGINADAFLYATPDSSLFDFPILAPGASASVAYDPGLLQGLLQLTWDALAPVGTTNSGLFLLSAEFWDGDPFAGGAVIGTAPDFTAAYSATVTGAAPVPEPATLLLMATGLGASGLLERRRRRRQRLAS